MRVIVKVADAVWFMTEHALVWAARRLEKGRLRC
jgi:hypothetical protein